MKISKLIPAFMLGGAALMAAEKKTNIIYILCDDLGIGELGCYGQEKIKTPNIDRLAKEGVKFTQHYSGSAVCAPARGTFITGKHTGHAQIRGNLGSPINGQYPLEPGTPTIGTMLQKAGYKTGIVGKWGLGGPKTEAHPNNLGFDFFYGLLDQWRAHNFYLTYYWRNKTVVPTMNKPQDLHDYFPKGVDVNDPNNYRKYTGKEHASELMIEEALGFIKENKDQPFFLYYATPIPHVALQAPKKWVNKYKGQFEETPYDGRRGGYLPCQHPRATYAGMVSFMDHNVGRMMAELEKHGIADNTIIVFTSDNGPTFNGGSDSKFFNSALNFRGLKCSVFEGGIRAPFIVRWPGKVKPNTTSDHLSAQWDMMATFAEIAKAEAPENDGISMVNALTGKKQQQHDYLYWEEARSKRAIRVGDWKAIQPHRGAKIALYNLKNDISETTDVSDKHPEVYKELCQKMLDVRTPSKVFPFNGIDNKK